MMSNDVECCRILSNFVEFPRILSNASNPLNFIDFYFFPEFHGYWSNVVECCRILSNYSRMLSKAGVECCRMSSNFVECCRILSNYSRMLSNVVDGRCWGGASKGRKRWLIPGTVLCMCVHLLLIAFVNDA